MLAGISRFSLRYVPEEMLLRYSPPPSRSMAATATFFLTGLITSQILHQNYVPPGASSDLSWPYSKVLLVLQAFPLISYGFLYYFVRPFPISLCSLP
jgi:hypothetical protein